MWKKKSPKECAKWTSWHPHFNRDLLFSTPLTWHSNSTRLEGNSLKLPVTFYGILLYGAMWDSQKS